MSTAPEASETAPQPIAPIEIVRVVVLLAVLATFTLWGFTAWTWPLNLVFGIGTPLLVLLLWALFLSARPVIVLHPFIRALVELLLYASTTAIWWSMGELWIGVGFAVVAVTVGLLAGRKAFT